MSKFTSFLKPVMMNKIYLLFCFLTFLPFFLFSQSKRPQVLIYGSGVDAYAAALQSAMSNLNTVWVLEGDQIAPELTSATASVTSGENLDAGLWADLLARTLGHDERSDSLSAIAKKRINSQVAQNVIDSTIETSENLTLVYGAGLRGLRKRGKDWQVELTTRQRYRVRAVVDASADADLHRLALGSDSVKTKTALDDRYFQPTAYNPLFRTGIAVGYVGASFTLPLAALVPGDDSNLFTTRGTPILQSLLTRTDDDIPLLMHVGQAVGAAAAYTAFFKTTSDRLDTRSVQGEVLQYGARIMPFTDIPLEDPHFGPIQRIGSTGMLEGTPTATGGLLFDPDRPVPADEIQPVLNQLFSRSQIWFIDHPALDTLTLADLFSLIKYIGHRGDELEQQVEKGWSRRFDFDGAYDEQRLATRRLVAVLLDAYCRPFDVKVGMDGSIQR